MPHNWPDMPQKQDNQNGFDADRAEATVKQEPLEQAQTDTLVEADSRSAQKPPPSDASITDILDEGAPVGHPGGQIRGDQSKGHRGGSRRQTQNRGREGQT